MYLVVVRCSARPDLNLKALGLASEGLSFKRISTQTLSENSGLLVHGATGAQSHHVINSLLASSEDGTPSSYTACASMLSLATTE